MQQVIPLSNTDGIKMTMARYYTPSDVNIDKTGIPPDLEVLNMQKMNAEQEELYMQMIKSEIITKTVDMNPEMTEEQIALEAETIAKDYPFEQRILRRLLRVQVQRHQTTPLYDLDWDLQLNKAIEILQSGSFDELIKSTKTLKELQDEKNLLETNSEKMAVAQ